MGAVLGCGEHRVMVAERGASRPLAELDFSGLSYGRVLDDMSVASLAIPADAECCGILGSLREWRHELWIYRDDRQVWKGPVTPQPSYAEDGVTVPAKDHFAWFERRAANDPAPSDARTGYTRFIFYFGLDVSSIFAGVLAKATQRDPHPRLQVELTPSNIVLPEWHVDPTQRPLAADVMRSLARFGADFTIIGDRILIGSPEVPANELTYLTSDVVSGVSVTPLPTASEVTITGSNTDTAGQPLVATVGYGGSSTDPWGAGWLPIDPLIGLVVESDNASDLTSQEAVNLAAQTRYDFYRGEPVSATFALDAQAPVTFDQLIPGAKVRLDIDATCRRLSDVYRLTRVEVNVAVSDSDISETVTIGVDPLGTVAA